MSAAEFDRFADDYLAIHSKNVALSGEVPGYFARYKIEEIRLRWTSRKQREPEAILDFGCGVGNSLNHFSELFPTSRITGYDVSERSLAVARRRVAAAVSLVLGDGEILGIEPQSQDLIFSACVFHHIEPAKRLTIMRRLLRLLRPGGALVVFEHNPNNPVTRHIVATCPFDDDAVLLSASELARLQVHAGFERVRTRFTGFFPARLAVLRRFEGALSFLPIGAQYYTFADV